MGKRRVRCLLANNIAPNQIIVFDTRTDRLEESSKEFSVSTCTDFELALADPALEAVIVSVPGFLHMKYCLGAARAGKHWFCEVPLAVNLDGIDELKSLASAKSLVGAPGCQLLFHALGRELKDWALGSFGGPILAASYALGTYLPEWHPHEDYRKFYASNKAMGGGNLDVIAQELAWIRWIINRPMIAVTCRTSKTGALELAEDTPDHQEIIVEFEGGLMLSMHFDLLDRSHERLIRLVTASSTLKWSNLDSSLQVYAGEKPEWKRIAQPDGYNYESCYHNEIGHFLQCIKENTAWPITLDTAEEIVRLLVALDMSDKAQRVIRLSEVSA